MVTQLLLIADTHVPKRARTLPDEVWRAVEAADGELRERVPEVARADVEWLRLGVVHETGQTEGREERMSALHPDLDVLVALHLPDADRRRRHPA